MNRGAAAARRGSRKLKLKPENGHVVGASKGRDDAPHRPQARAVDQIPADEGPSALPWTLSAAVHSPLNAIAPAPRSFWRHPMPKSPTNPAVDKVVSKTKEWREETEALRALALGCGLTEELKWGKPCYSFQGSNVAIIQGFKEYCALLFTKGVLLRDAKGLLVRPGENTQAARQLRFTDLRAIVALKPTINAYLEEAIAAEKAGLKVEFKAITELTLTPELQKQLDENSALKTAFDALTPGRRRAYHLFFSGAKQSATRAARVEKCVPRILAGTGLND